MAKWLEEKMDFLRENYEKMTCEDMARQLGRTYDSVRSKVSVLGLGLPVWEQSKVDYLIKNYYKKSVKSIARDLGLTVLFLNVKVTELGLQRRDGWDEDEDEFLAENFNRCEIKEMAEILECHEDVVRCRCEMLGLKKRPEFVFPTEDEWYNKDWAKDVKRCINMQKVRGGTYNNPRGHIQKRKERKKSYDLSEMRKQSGDSAEGYRNRKGAVRMSVLSQ